MELKPCPFCGSKEAVEYWCHYDVEDCPLHDVDEFENYDECEFAPYCHKSHTFVVCNAKKGGCGATSGYDDHDAGMKWNKRTVL